MSAGEIPVDTLSIHAKQILSDLNSALFRYIQQDKQSYASWIDPFVEKGFDYIVCTGVLNSLRLFPDYKQALPNIRNFIREGAQKGAMGVLNTIWDDGGLHSFDRDWYGGWEEVHEACLEVDSILSLKTSQYDTREYAAFQIVSDEYKYLAQAKLKLAEASALYSEACCIQYIGRDKARQLLNRARINIVKCQGDFNRLKEDFNAIWKSENRDYWNNFALDPFKEVLCDYADLITSLDQSVEYFEQKLPLSTPADIRLDIREMAGSYFTYWLISPAFDLKNGTGFDHDFLKEMGGEQNASPFPGFSFFDSNGKNVKWMKYSSPLSDKVSLNTILDSDNKAVSYAFCTLESPGPKKVTASLGVNRSIEVFCNGTSVFKKIGNETMLIDEFQCPLNLNAGKNRILLKIEKGNTAWDFSFGIKDETISNSKNKYRISGNM